MTAEHAAERADRLTAVGRYADAERVARQGLEEYPDNPRLLGELADALHRQDREAEALTAAESAVAVAPNYVWGHQLRSHVLSALGRHAEAVEAARTAVELAPHDPPVFHTLASALSDAGKPLEAKRVAERQIELAPHSASAHNLRGNILLQLGFARYAMESYRQALRLDPGHAGALHNLALAELNVNNPGRALRLLLEAGQLEPQMRQLRPNLVRTLSAVSWWPRLWVLAATVVLLTVGAVSRVAFGVVLVVGVVILWWPLRDLPKPAWAAVKGLVWAVPTLSASCLALAALAATVLVGVATGSLWSAVAVLVVFVISAFWPLLASSKQR